MATRSSSARQPTSEYQASERGGRRGAAQDALRLYSAVAEYFPSSPLAAEAAYRAADIRWQLDLADQRTRPSAKLRDPHMRLPLDESYMKKVIKKYPGTKWADLAAYNMIDNKLCGDWEAQAECPVKETEIYVKYVDEHPKSPKAPEALYNAAWRQAALITIYKTDNQQKKADDAAARAVVLGKRLVSQYPDSNRLVEPSSHSDIYGSDRNSGFRKYGGVAGRILLNAVSFLELS